MSNTATLPLDCPKCYGAQANLLVSSYTVLTVQCVLCLHTWAAEIASLPDSVRRRLPVRDSNAA
jgi:hypothetical protein